MKLTELSAISPVDGRYRKKVEELAPFFLGIRTNPLPGFYRDRIFYRALPAAPGWNYPAWIPGFLKHCVLFYTEFAEADAEKIKEFEKTTNHDVKAVEYFIKEKFDEIRTCQSTRNSSILP